MITIGVTGGVGAGKSEILRYLDNNYSCRILMSDNAAKELEAPGGTLYEPLVRLLEEADIGDGSSGPLLLENGEIDKKEMAARIFSDAQLLTKINELVHPAVNKYIREEIAREKKSGEKEFFILESALLIENGYDRILDSMWYIYCEESVRSSRLKASRGYSDEKIRSIMMSQVSEDVFRSHWFNGVGYYSFMNYNKWNVYAHNNYMELLADVGIVGFCTYYWFYFNNLLGYFRIKTPKTDFFKVRIGTDFMKSKWNFLGVTFFFTLMFMEWGQVTYFRLYVLIPLLVVTMAIEDMKRREAIKRSEA